MQKYIIFLGKQKVVQFLILKQNIFSLHLQKTGEFSHKLYEKYASDKTEGAAAFVDNVK